MVRGNKASGYISINTITYEKRIILVLGLAISQEKQQYWPLFAFQAHSLWVRVIVLYRVMIWTLSKFLIFLRNN